jgi:hypothetical protein
MPSAAAALAVDHASNALLPKRVRDRRSRSEARSSDTERGEVCGDLVPLLRRQPMCHGIHQMCVLPPRRSRANSSSGGRGNRRTGRRGSARGRSRAAAPDRDSRRTRGRAALGCRAARSPRRARLTPHSLRDCCAPWQSRGLRSPVAHPLLRRTRRATAHGRHRSRDAGDATARRARVATTDLIVVPSDSGA